MDVMKEAHRESGAEIVTVAVRRINLDRTRESLLDSIPPEMTLLPNTAGCYTADDAVRTARLGREVGLSNWVKLEVLGDERTLWPDNAALLDATRTLVREGFVVFPYTSDDPVVCRHLEEEGAAAVMPLGAPIGSGLGIQNPNNISSSSSTRSAGHLDAGVGTASDVVHRDGARRRGVLLNTAIAGAKDPSRMCPRHGASRLPPDVTHFWPAAFPKKRYATASMPIEGRPEPRENRESRRFSGFGPTLVVRPGPPRMSLPSRSSACYFAATFTKPAPSGTITMFSHPPSVRPCGKACARSKGGRS